MKIIAHLDMDAFFAAVEEREHPRFKGRSIAVGSDPKGGRGRGVVSTANYKAREYGIRSATPISKAWQLSEQAEKAGKQAVIFLPVNMRLYSKVSKNIFAIVEKYTKLYEPASIDEIYFDLSYLKDFQKAKEIIKKIKKEIAEKEKLTCSVGLAKNKLIAKIASDFQKPNGLTVVLPGGEFKFLENLPIRKVPGIGPKTEKTLNKAGISTVGGIVAFGKKGMENLLGSHGKDLYLNAQGEGDDEMRPEEDPKSIGEQDTFEVDTLDSDLITKRLYELCAGVFHSFKKEGFKFFKNLVITIRYSGFETVSHGEPIGEGVKTLKDLKFESLRMLLPYLDKRKNKNLKKIRLIGIRLEKLSKKYPESHLPL
jgi:DNA polymerase IV (DinB-like DNA polymerase)